MPRQHTPWDESDFFPKSPPNLEDHHAVLHRHGRLISSHTNQLIDQNKRVVSLEDSSPINEIHELEKRLMAKVQEIDTQVRVEVARIRTALILLGALLGGGYSAGKIVDTLQPPQPVNVQVVAPKGP